MRLIRWVSLHAKDFKCFGAEPQGFDAIKPVNVIIGRNNTGKSALLDMIQHAMGGTAFSHRGHKRSDPEMTLKYRLTSESIDALLAGEPSYHVNREIYQVFAG